MGLFDKATKKASQIYEILTEEDEDNQKNEYESEQVNENELENNTENENEEDIVAKGDEFEKYVANLFKKDYFSIVEWTNDINRKRDQYVEADGNPDLVIRYQDKKKNEKFAVECKFRSGLYKGKLQWSKPYQMERYGQYAKENDIPVYIVIGLGGEPSKPERMFCVPLEEAKYPGLYPSLFEQFERDPENNFFWKNGKLE